MYITFECTFEYCVCDADKYDELQKDASHSLENNVLAEFFFFSISLNELVYQPSYNYSKKE